MQWSPEEIDVLSIGCTEEAIDFKQRGHGGLFWIKKGIDAALRGQSRSALGMARHLTGRDKGLEKVVRINPPVAAGRFCLDGVKGISELQGVAYGEARHRVSELKDRFFAVTAEPSLQAS